VRATPGPNRAGSGHRSPSAASQEASRVGYLGLGSNVGDRAGHLRSALELLGEHGVEVKAVSSLYETEPVGEVLDQPDFLNAAARISTALDPHELLDLCKAIEVEQGRLLAGPRHGPRPLDVDLLLLGSIELRSERLTLPHPQVTARRFVLAPLLELDPALELPDGTRLSDALGALGDVERVERIGEL
jgi:2-amino-4-hydroxy-6-hydroxymethyldihydropteridine diphosphokinase